MPPPGPPAEQFDKRFPRRCRVRDRKIFQLAFAGKAFAADEVLVVSVVPGEPERLRIGITIPRRTGSAVQRNRWKRLIREAFRHSRNQLPTGWDLIVRPKRGAVADDAAIRRSLPRLVERAVRRKGR
jgi:ribonuclease P protein component